MIKCLGRKGENTLHKQEYETCLHGATMAYKDDPRICLRGMLDGLHAKAVLYAIQAKEQGDETLSGQIQQIAVMALALIQAEYNHELPQLPLLDGKTEEQIHEASHFPKQVYGVDHFFPTVETGYKIALLNVLRTEIRDCERQAVAVYKNEFPTFIQALNRLSSYAYCLMCEQKAKQEVER